MKKGIIAVLFVLIAVGVSNAQVTAIRAGRIVDPETGTVASNQIILIEGQDIKAIGANVAIPPGATVVDLSRETVIPGMMDAHAHLCMNTQHKRDGGRYYFTTLLDSNAKPRSRVRSMRSRCLSMASPRCVTSATKAIMRASKSAR
ncbi:MAG: hypothetical protein IPG58_13900 [Acidobacteria bacterium]|nr:hypothetical protein [Acidobacteriota bacterium]